MKFVLANYKELTNQQRMSNKLKLTNREHVIKLYGYFLRIGATPEMLHVEYGKAQ